MSVLTQLRETTAQLLATDDLQVFSAMPDRIVPPAAVVLPGTPYLEPSGTFGTFTARLSVVLIVNAKVNATATAELDDLIEDAVVDLVNAGISVGEISEPWQLSAQNATYLAVTISTAQPVAL